MGNLKSIQCLRGVAALMVVLFHANLLAFLGGTDDGSVASLGAAGVDIFFVISGVVMWLSTATRAQSPQSFWRNRAIRIVPLYYLLTLTYVILLAASGRFVSVGDVVTSALFIPATNSLSGDPVPILGIGWTLNYEMVFYLLFGLTLLLPKAWRIPVIGAVFIGLASLRFIAPSDHAFMVRTSSPIWLEFLAGLVIGVIVERGWFRSPLFGAALVIGGVAALIGIQLVAPGLPRTIVWGGPAAMIVLGSVLLEPVFRTTVLEPVRRLGDVSYSLYLVHGIWIEALVLMRVPPMPLFILAIVGSVGLGFGLYYVAERPLLRLFKRKPASVVPITCADTNSV